MKYVGVPSIRNVFEGLQFEKGWNWHLLAIAVLLKFLYSNGRVLEWSLQNCQKLVLGEFLPKLLP